MFTEDDKNKFKDIVKQYKTNDEISRSMIQIECEMLLMEMRLNGILEDYVVVCDETNNVKEDIDNFIVNIHIVVKPRTKATTYHFKISAPLTKVNLDGVRLKDIKW